MKFDDILEKAAGDIATEDLDRRKSERQSAAESNIIQLGSEALVQLGIEVAERCRSSNLRQMGLCVVRWEWLKRPLEMSKWTLKMEFEARVWQLGHYLVDDNGKILRGGNHGDKLIESLLEGPTPVKRFDDKTWEAKRKEIVEKRRRILERFEVVDIVRKRDRNIALRVGDRYSYYSVRFDGRVLWADNPLRYPFKDDSDNNDPIDLANYLAKELLRFC